jgi:hypothetical protein
LDKSFGLFWAHLQKLNKGILQIGEMFCIFALFFKLTIMTTTVKTKPTDSAKKQEASVANQEPKRLSKAGQWRRDNPEGMFIVVDRRAANK